MSLPIILLDLGPSAAVAIIPGASPSVSEGFSAPRPALRAENPADHKGKPGQVPAAGPIAIIPGEVSRERSPGDASPVSALHPFPQALLRVGSKQHVGAENKTSGQELAGCFESVWHRGHVTALFGD